MEYPFQLKTGLVNEHNYGVLCDRSGVKQVQFNEVAHKNVQGCGPYELRTL
jgi:hypothetical protein